MKETAMSTHGANTGEEAAAALPERARAFAAPLMEGRSSPAGEAMLAHADGTAAILEGMDADAEMRAAAHLCYAAAQLSRPEPVLTKAFGAALTRLALETLRLEAVQARSRALPQGETVRRMLLAFSRDARVVVLRLASRLQTLRWHAAEGRDLPPELLHETAQVFAPLANRLGIWQIKWEIEDLVLRAQEPAVYRAIAQQLGAKRRERVAEMERQRTALQAALRAQGIDAQVSGRPKHISSIVRKMRGKKLAFHQLMDVRALRVLVPTEAACYATLAWVHSHFAPVPGEFDDYIARPKANGYQSLHTVVRDAEGRAWEVQIRTRAMHEMAENGVAAHWAYKEAGVRGYAGVSAASSDDAKLATLRRLLAWGREVGAQQPEGGNPFDDRIYVLTPDARIVELPAGATPVDFAYAVHTELGHRCRGARIDGAMAPLHTRLANGQSVEVIAAKEGGPSRDWLNPELHYLASPRARAKVRAWFNAQHLHETIARGREVVEKLLQRLGRTALAHEALAAGMGFKSAEVLFESVGKDELSPRSIEAALRPPEAKPATAPDAAPVLRSPLGKATRGGAGVLVRGMAGVLTQPARCCKPAPPDEIAGYVTRGKGVTIHRKGCPELRHLAQSAPERLIEVAWGSTEAAPGAAAASYPVGVRVQASDRSGLLRDISDIFARARVNITDVQTHLADGSARMDFTVQVADTRRLTQVLAQLKKMPGVRHAGRV